MCVIAVGDWRRALGWNRWNITPRLNDRDRILWILLRRSWFSWRRHVLIVQPDTVSRSVSEASPSARGDEPRHLLRDRDRIYGSLFQKTARNLGIEEVLTAHRSPWQNTRLVGTFRRECPDHVIIFLKGPVLGAVHHRYYREAA